AGVRALPGAGDLLSSAAPPSTRVGDAGGRTDLAAELAALTKRHAELTRQYQELRAAHEILLKRQAEAYDRIGAAMERLRRVRPGVAAGITDDLTKDEQEHGAGNGHHQWPALPAWLPGRRGGPAEGAGGLCGRQVDGGSGQHWPDWRCAVVPDGFADFGR